MTDDEKKKKESSPGYVMTMDEIEKKMKGMDEAQTPLPNPPQKGGKKKVTEKPLPNPPQKGGDGNNGGAEAAVIQQHTERKDDGGAAQPQHTEKTATPATPQKVEDTTTPKVKDLNLRELTATREKAAAAAAGVDADDVDGYDKILNILGKNAELSAAEEEGQRKREKRDMLVRSIGDGISAIAGLVGSASGSPNTVNHEMSLTKAGTELRDKIRKEREERRDLYTRRALAAARVDAENRRTKSLSEKAQQQAELARYKAENSIEIAKKKLELAQSKQEFEEGQKEALLELKKRQLDIEAEWKAGMLSTNQYKAQTDRINAEANMIRAQRYQGGRSSSGGSSSSGGKESASAWMYRIQDEDPEGYQEAAKGALGWAKPNPTSAEAGQIRERYNATQRRRAGSNQTNSTNPQPTPPKPAGNGNNGNRGSNGSNGKTKNGRRKIRI